MKLHICWQPLMRGIIVSINRAPCGSMSAPAELGRSPGFAHPGGSPPQRQLPLTGPLRSKLPDTALSARARGPDPGHASPLRTNDPPPPATDLFSAFSLSFGRGLRRQPAWRRLQAMMHVNVGMDYFSRHSNSSFLHKQKVC